MKKERLKDFRVSVQFISSLAKIGKKTVDVEKGLPADAIVHDVYFDPKDRCFHLFIESESFPEVSEGDVVPYFEELVTMRDIKQ